MPNIAEYPVTEVKTFLQANHKNKQELERIVYRVFEGMAAEKLEKGDSPEAVIGEISLMDFGMAPDQIESIVLRVHQRRTLRTV